MPTNWPKLLRRGFTKIFPVWYLIEYAVIRITMAFINLFPIAISTWIARRIGDIAYLLLPKRRETALENLTIAFGNSKKEREKKRLVLESFRHLAVAFMEFLRIPKFAKVSARHIHFEGTEHMDNAFARGKGLILVMSHLGVWEYLGFIPYLKKCPAAVVGRALRNPCLYRWVRWLRELMGLRYIDKDMGAKGIFSELRQNHLVAIVIDQWAGNEGIWINFFNKPTSTTSLPARLAERTGTALIPAYCVRIRNGEYAIKIESEVVFGEDKNSPEDVTKELNRRLEESIRAFPEQWMWTHKRWKNKVRNTKVS